MLEKWPHLLKESTSIDIDNVTNIIYDTLNDTYNAIIPEDTSSML